MQVFNLGSFQLDRTSIGSVKFCGKGGKKDSTKTDSIPQALDIRSLRLDRGVINERDPARVRS